MQYKMVPFPASLLYHKNKEGWPMRLLEIFNKEIMEVALKMEDW